MPRWAYLTVISQKWASKSVVDGKIEWSFTDYRWFYRRGEEPSGGKVEGPSTWLHDLGDEGWELIDKTIDKSVTYNDGQGWPQTSSVPIEVTYTFKRPA